MKIAIFTSVYYPEHFLINSLSTEFVKKGNEVQVYTGLPNYPQGKFFPGYSWRGPYREKYEGVDVIRVPMVPRGKNFKGLILNYASSLISGCLSIFRLKRPDISLVFATSPIMVAIPAIIVRWIYGVPVVIWLQDLWPESISSVGALSSDSFIIRLIGRMVKWIYDHSDFILIQSPFFEENLKKYNFPLARTAYLPNWAEETIGKQSPDWLKIEPHQFIATFAGNIGIAQSVDTIYEAAKLLQEHKNIKFLIVGDGREKERLKNKSHEEGLKNISFVGRKPFSDMGGLFQVSDVLIVTLRKQEIFQNTIPAKVQQYLASGRPLICATGGIGNKIVSESQGGFVCNPENASELAEAVLKMYRLSSEERKEMGERGNAFASQHFDRSGIVEKILSHLEEVFHGSKV